MKYFFALSFAILSATTFGQTIVYHDVQTDSSGNLIAWYNPNRGSSYDHTLNLLWNFWNTMPSTNGYENYMIDHSYGGAVASGNKVGGDQFAMALSSWALYYAYTGDADLLNNMKYIADNYLAHSLSSSSAAWANLPYSCNFSTPSYPIYDGDFLIGAGVMQPDKAGSFGNELVTLYKITGDTFYLNTAIRIANTLAAKVQPGDSTNSPYPFKVYAESGNPVITYPGANYTTNFVSTLSLYENLKKLNAGNVVDYDSAKTTIIRWVKQYPLQNNNWGCFFENIPVYSNTEINAVTMAWYILNHSDEWGGSWQQDARGILDWTLLALGSDVYDSLGVTAIFEQSADLKEGGSHTSRFGSVELLYAEKTGDGSRVTQAIRQLDWATYLVDFDGKCRFSPREGSIWYTDGYGDFVRHYLRAMSVYPAIAPDSANHLLGSTSVITNINYSPYEITYNTFDNSSVEVLRLTSKPLDVKLNGNSAAEVSTLSSDGWLWIPYPLGGVLKVRHDNAKSVDILWGSSGIETIDGSSWDVLPNPANGFIEIGFNGGTIARAQISIMDVSGKSLINQDIYSDKTKIDVSTLSTGLYFVQLASGKGSSIKKIFIQH